MTDTTALGDLYTVPINSLEGDPVDLADYSDREVLIVNVASRCGLTPQYTGLEQLQERYSPRGFAVIGVPSNQFAGQEPGTPEEIRTFCSTTYGVTFPLLEKVDVNGEARHPLYSILTEVSDAAGYSGDIRWNFEKFLVSPGARSIRRFSPKVEPEDAELVSAIEAGLPR
jgi:glutathione peroxidase